MFVSWITTCLTIGASLFFSVYNKYPLHYLKCPRGLQEADFVDLLKSTFPQLAADEPFDVLTADRNRRLQPLKVEPLTPEELYRAIKASGNNVLFVRLKVLQLTG